MSKRLREAVECYGKCSNGDRNEEIAAWNKQMGYNWGVNGAEYAFFQYSFMRANLDHCPHRGSRLSISW